MSSPSDDAALVKAEVIDVDESKSKVSSAKVKVSNVVAEIPKTVVDVNEAKKLRSRIWSLVYPYSQWMFFGLVGSAMVGGAFPLWGLLLAQTQSMFYLTDTNELRHESVIVAERFFMLGIDCLIGYTLLYFCVGLLGHRIVTKLRSDLFESFFRREIGFFDDEKNSVGALTTSLAEDTRLVHECTGETFANQLQALFTLLAGLLIGFTASWKITMVVLATFPLNIASAAIKMKDRSGQQ